MITYTLMITIQNRSDYQRKKDTIVQRSSAVGDSCLMEQNNSGCNPENERPQFLKVSSANDKYFLGRSMPMHRIMIVVVVFVPTVAVTVAKSSCQKRA